MLEHGLTMAATAATVVYHLRIFDQTTSTAALIGKLEFEPNQLGGTETRQGHRRGEVVL